MPQTGTWRHKEETFGHKHTDTHKHIYKSPNPTMKVTQNALLANLPVERKNIMCHYFEQISQ